MAKISRLGFAAVAVAAVALLVVIATGSSSNARRVSVVLTNATNVVDGQWVRDAGAVVGSVDAVTPVDHGRAARITFGLDQGAWPLRQGTTFEQRFGGTISYSNRYFLLHPGPPDAPALADGATLPPSDVTFPVEYDKVLDTFTPTLRAQVKSFLDNGGVALHAARSAMHQSLAPGRAPAAVSQAAAVFDDLYETDSALTSLIAHGDRVVDAVDASNPDLGSLILGASSTFNAMATQARGVQATIARAPATLVTARSTLVQAEHTLTEAASLSTKLSPGIGQLRQLADPLDDVLVTVARVGPDASTTLRTLHEAAPNLSGLLSSATSTMPRLASVSQQGTTAMRCVRPYSPEIAGFFSGWDGFLAYSDGHNKYVRLEAQVSPYPNGTPLTPSQFLKALSYLSYSFPEPPGYNGGQPWLQPQCGIGANALNPDDDPMDGYKGPTGFTAATTTEAVK